MHRATHPLMTFGTLILVASIAGCQDARFSGTGDQRGAYDPNNPNNPNPSVPSSSNSTPQTGNPDQPTEQPGGLNEEGGDRPLGPGTLFGNRLDSSDVKDGRWIELRNVDGGEWQRINWPARGQTVQMQRLCSPSGTTHLEIKAGGSDGEDTGGPQACFLGSPRDGRRVTVAFELGCRGKYEYKHIDDAIATIRCGVNPIVVDGIVMNSAIPMLDWVEGLFTDGIVDP